MNAKDFCKGLCDLSNSLGGCSHVKDMKLLNKIKVALGESETTDDTLWRYKHVIRKGLNHLTELLSDGIDQLNPIETEAMSFPIWFEDQLEITSIGYGLYNVVYADKEDGAETIQILDKYELLHFYRQKMKDLLHCQGKASPKIATLEKGFL